ncbi:MAG: Adaptive-response sensory-kinase SasA [Anaerolineales bacterium]|nr:Adaptive-response sensory-kinase SasA [Anaerolineales bacterium]
MNIQAKLVFPLAATILLLVLVLSPLTTRIVNRRIENEADQRLGEIADSVGALIANSEEIAKGNAALLAGQPEVVGYLIGLEMYKDALARYREDLGLQELSLYSMDFKLGGQAYFYGGPMVTRRLQVNEEATLIREQLILGVIDKQSPGSAVTIAPQNSQIMGAAPVFDASGNMIGVLLAAFYVDEAYIHNIAQIIDTDIAIVRDNAVIVSTLDPKSRIELLINEGWLSSAPLPATNVVYGDGSQHRLLAHPLEITGNTQGTVLVAQPIEQLFGVNKSIQAVLIALTIVFGLAAMWFWIAAFITFTRPLAQLTEATTSISHGDLSQRVNTTYLLFRDEITLLSENFNLMIAHLQESYARIEERVEQRTQELAEARDEAVSANRSKSEFVSLVSHELKLPMTSIKGYSELMLKGATGLLNEQQTQFLETIHNNVNRMAALVSDLADISRIESGNLRLEIKAAEVREVIDEALGLTQTQVDAKHQTLTVKCEPGLPQAFCDRARLVQALTNLISNANKYSPRQGEILVQARRVDGSEMIEISVCDNGFGITAEDREKMFEKFFRSSDEKIRESPGTGLGLSITKNLVELQGGRIWLESDHGKGTTVYFTVPAARPESHIPPSLP